MINSEHIWLPLTKGSVFAQLLLQAIVEEAGATANAKADARRLMEEAGAKVHFWRPTFVQIHKKPAQAEEVSQKRGKVD